MIVPSSVHQHGFGALSRTAQNAYYYLATYANSEGVCWPGHSRITEETGITHKPLVRALKELESLGWIFRLISTGRGHSTRYQLYTKGGQKRPLYDFDVGAGVSKNGQEKGVKKDPPSSNEQTIMQHMEGGDGCEGVLPSNYPSRKHDSFKICA
jgi:hypothetical protein